MSYYERAAIELKENRNDDLWYECLSKCEMDVKKASAMYIRESAEIIGYNEFRNRELRREADERIEEEIRIEEENQKKIDDQWEALMERQEASHSQMPLIKPGLGLILFLIMSCITFAQPLTEGVDGFFSALWRWPIAIIHMATSSMAGYSLAFWLRRRLVVDYYAAKIGAVYINFFGPACILISSLMWAAKISI